MSLTETSPMATTQQRVCLYWDIENSTGLRSQLTTPVWEPIRRQVAALFKASLPGDDVVIGTDPFFKDKIQPARIISDNGDGDLAIFLSSKDAVETALKFQCKIAHHDWGGVPIRVCVGIDGGETDLRPSDDHGVLIPTGKVMDNGSRVASVAGPAQILITARVSADARDHMSELPNEIRHQPDGSELKLHFAKHGFYDYQGRREDDDLLFICEVGIHGITPFDPPPSSAKCWSCDAQGQRIVSEKAEWQPVMGTLVPGNTGGSWELIRKLGAGGFGEAWLAVEQRTRAKRVFKFPNDPQRARSFFRETTLATFVQNQLTQLGDAHHANAIAKVVGLADDTPFWIATEYYPEGSLVDWCASQPGGIEALSPQQRIDFVIELCRAVHAAHQVGVVHRDIKPSNIFVRHDPGTDTIHPILADFGIGCILHPELLDEQGYSRAGFTHPNTLGPGSRTGTSIYAPPEYEKMGAKASAKGDVFSLGVVLYQMLISDFGQPWDSAQECERRLPNDPTHRLRPFLRKAILQALDAEAHRYATAEDFACALEHLEQDYQNDEGTKARLRSQRLRRLVAVAAAAALVLVGLTIWAVKGERSTAIERDRAGETVVKLKEANAQQQSLLLSASYADHESAIRAFSEKRDQEGLAYFERALRFAPKNTGALAAAAQRSVGMNAPKWRTRSVTAFGKSVNCVAFSPDGRYLGAGGSDKTARVIETATGKEISRTEFLEDVTCVSFSPDGHYLAAGSGDKTARVIEMTTGKEISRAVFAGMVRSVSFSPDSRFLVAGSVDKTAQMIDAATGKAIWRAHFQSGVASVSFSPDGRYFAAGIWDETARVIETVTGKEISRSNAQGIVLSVSFSPDGRLLLVTTLSSTKRMFEAVTGKLVYEVADASCIAFSPDGRYVAAGSKHNARVIELATGKQISKTEFLEHVICVSFSPDGRYFAVGSADKTARLIETATGKEISRTEFLEDVTCVSFSPDGRYFAAGTGPYKRSGEARVIEAATGRELSKSEFAESTVTIDFSGDGLYLAACDHSSARVVEAATGREIIKVDFAGWVRCVRFSPDGRYFAAGSNDKTARVIEATTGKEIFKAVFGDEVNTVSFSPDGRYLAAGSGDKTARVIEMTTGKEISRAVFAGKVNSVTFNPDGRYLAAGSWQEARVIETATGREVSKAEFEEWVTCISFSPDGRYLAAGSGDKTVRVIEMTTGKETSKAEFRGGVNCLGFSPDGRFLAAGSEDDTARIVETATGKEIGRPVFTDQVTSLCFSPDGRFLVVGSWQQALVIEAATSKEICKLDSPEWVCGMRFSPDSRLLATACTSGTLRVTEAVWKQTDIIPTHAFIQALRHSGGSGFNPSGQLTKLTTAAIADAQTEVTAFIQAPAPPEARWQHAILTWAAMTPETRTTSPWTTEPLRVAAGRWFMQASGKVAAFITDTADEAPWHPLEPISLARLEPKPDAQTDTATREPLLTRPRFLARLTLQRLRAADAQLYGRDTLAEYATWCAKILREELNLEAEAQEALTFAQERKSSPPSPSSK